MSFRVTIETVIRSTALLALLTGAGEETATAQTSSPNQVYLRRFALTSPRRGHTTTTLGDNRVAIVGGMNQKGALGEIEILDPAKAYIAPVAALGVPRTDHSATLLADGGLIVIGGSNRDGLLDSTEVFDPRTNRLSAGPKLHRPRAGHTATRLDDGRILIAGGRLDDSAEILDPSRGESTLLTARLGGARHSHSAILLQNGDVLLVGGVGADNASLDTAEIFKKTALKFAATDAWMQARRVRPGLNLLPDGKIQVIGGDADRTIEMYDPKGRYFRANARLLPTADAVGSLALLASSTRLGLIDSVAAARPEDSAADFTRVDAGERKLFGEALDALFHSQPNGESGSFSAQAAGGARSQDGTAIPLVFAGQKFRADYTSTEIPGRNEALVGAVPKDEDALLESVILIRRSPATVSTDRIEYAPDGRPVLAGTGWTPNEKVRIVRQSARTNERRVFEAQATSFGTFVYSGLSPADHEVGAYIVSAIGQSSGYAAQTAYMSGPRIDPASSGKAPFRFSIPNVPLSGETSGTVQTPGGALKWSLSDVTPRDGLTPNPQQAAGESVGQAADGVKAAAGFSYNSPDVSFNPGCLSLPSSSSPLIQMCPSGSAHLDGSMSVDGGFDAGALPNPACCVCEEIPGVSCGDVCSFSCGGRLPSLSASFSIKSNFKTNLASDFTLQGQLANVNNIHLVDFRRFDAGYPALSVGGVSIPGTSNDATFGIHLSLGLLAGVNLKVTEPMKFHTDLGFDLKNIELSVGASTSSGFTQSAHGTGSATAGFKLLEIGSTTLTLSVGVGANGKIQLKDTCDPLIDATLRPVAAFIDGTFQSSGAASSCQKYNLSSDWGFRTDGTINAGCGALTIQPASFAADIFRAPIGSLNTGLFRDTGLPSISCPANIVLPTAPGVCASAATYAATASDTCSGLKTGFGPQLSLPSGSTFGLGATTVTATAKDNAETADFPLSSNPNSASCQFSVTVEDRERPMLAPIADVLGKSSDPGKCGAIVNFAMNAGDNCPGVKTNSGPYLPGALFPVGLTNVTANAVDTSGNSTPRTFKVEIVDREAPAIAAISASPATLWPPNRKLVPVTINYTPSDNCAVQTCKLSVVSNEPVGNGDIQVIDAHRLLLAADRLGSGNGRTYTTTITCTDTANQSTVRTVNVIVPHNSPK